MRIATRGPLRSNKFAVDAHTDHDHRQCFDREDSQWVTSPSTTLATPPPVFSPCPTHTAEPVVEIAIDGLHNKRPPPIS
jgi:hypothetical protein